MDKSLLMKIVVFIILALFTSWPYFEKIKDYSWLKRIWIGGSILCLIAFGIWDIINTDDQLKASDKQAKADKSEIVSDILGSI